VATQAGVIYRIALDGTFPPAVFGDVSGLLNPNSGDEEGLLGIAISPTFEADGRVFVNYSAAGPRRSVLARFNVVDGVMDPASQRVILQVEQPTSINIAGRLAFGPDSYLYWALGDGGPEGDPNEKGQDLSSLQSSILRLDVSGDAYTVPPDNPFVNVQGAAPEKFAYGLRNPWGFSFDQETGDLWAGDVGDSLWEEVDRVVAGGNYGWSVMEGFECYATSSCDQTGLSLPRAAYGHDAGCAVVGGYVYRGSQMPELEGWYVYGDYCSGAIWALDASGTGPPVRIVDSDQTISSFGQLPDGEIVVVTFDRALFALQRASQ
jgi:glucose/arabinose dehydrogenase